MLGSIFYYMIGTTHTWEMFETFPKKDEDCLSFIGDIEFVFGFLSEES